jgi:ribonuclease P protein component
VRRAGHAPRAGEAELMRAAQGCLVILKRRSEFLRVRRGIRWSAPAFVLEAKLRDAAAGAANVGAARFGFTITRQVGKAVERNRIKRRLKAAVARAVSHARVDCDYVLIARRVALAQPFDALLADVVAAFDCIHRSPPERRRRKETGNKLAG